VVPALGIALDIRDIVPPGCEAEHSPPSSAGSRNVELGVIPLCKILAVSVFRTFREKRGREGKNRRRNKKFLEELIQYFPLI
jgi:hypothetical protein